MEPNTSTNNAHGDTNGHGPVNGHGATAAPTSPRPAVSNTTSPNMEKERMSTMKTSDENATQLNFDGGETLTAGPSIVDGRRYPRGGDYEAQYFATESVPDFKKVARIGNPTPLPVACFAICLLIASMALMGWGDMLLTDIYADLGVFYFIGGLGMAIGGIGELIIGNAFAYTVFLTFSGYWMAFASTFNSSMGVAANSQALGAEGPRAQGIALGFWQGAFILLDIIFLLCSLRTNLVFVAIFLLLVPTFSLLTVYLSGTSLSPKTLEHCAKATGSFGFIVSLLGFYLLTSILLGELDGPALPVGDLSGVWARRKAAAEQRRRRGGAGGGEKQD